MARTVQLFPENGTLGMELGSKLDGSEAYVYIRSFRRTADGDKLPAERNRKVSRNDCILEVDGVSTKEKRISDVIKSIDNQCRRRMPVTLKLATMAQARLLNAKVGAVDKRSVRKLIDGNTRKEMLQSGASTEEMRNMTEAMSSGNNSTTSSSSTSLSSTRRVAVMLSPKRGMLGMEIEADGRRVKVQGFYTDRGETMPAEASGQITVGDYLLKINGKFVKGYDDAMSRLGTASRSGGKVSLDFRTRSIASAPSAKPSSPRPNPRGKLRQKLRGNESLTSTRKTNRSRPQQKLGRSARPAASARSARPAASARGDRS